MSFAFLCRSLCVNVADLDLLLLPLLLLLLVHVHHVWVHSSRCPAAGEAASAGARRSPVPAWAVGHHLIRAAEWVGRRGVGMAGIDAARIAHLVLLLLLHLLLHLTERVLL